MPPRGRPKTRALFEEYELRSRNSIHPGGNQRQIRKDAAARWMTLTRPQQVQFVTGYNALMTARAARDPDLDRVNEASGEAERIQTGDPRKVDWGHYMEAAAAASPLCLALAAPNGLQDTVIRFCRALRITALALPVHVDTNQYARDDLAMERQTLANLRQYGNMYADHANNTPVPARPDGKLKIFEDWVPHWKIANSDHVRLNRFRRDGPSGDPNNADHQNWIGAWLFDGGAMATSGIWIELDHNNTVVDRVVRKDTYKTRAEWSSNTMWDGDIRGPSPKPFEISCHEALHGIGVSVPKFIEGGVDHALRRYRIYMGYCGRGNLFDLIKRHKANEPLPRPVPEQFLWWTFGALAEVGLAMEKGHIHLGPPEDNWFEVVHRDVKPGNVFLDDPPADVQYFPQYPTPRLGDFGLAIKTWPEDRFNPEIYLGAGTRGFMAPEQDAYVNARSATLAPVDRFKMLSKANVYGVGMIMFSLATLTNRPDEPFWLGDGRADEKDLRYMASAASYSAELKLLITKCIRFDPHTRPTFEEIMNEVIDVMHQHRTGSSNELLNKSDAYRIGLARRLLPPRRHR